MVELRHAIDEGIPIIFVYEPVAKGDGCTLKKHIETCPDDIRPVLEQAAIVPWYRLRQFQDQSLLKILRRIFCKFSSFSYFDVFPTMFSK